MADPRKTILVYGNRTKDQIVFPDEIDALAEAERTQVVHVLREPHDGWSGHKGVVDADLIAQVFHNEQFESWVCVVRAPKDDQQR